MAVLINTYANNKEEAVVKFNNYKNVDPFPDIPPSLLNSADIQDYVAATGMIYPFNFEKDDNFKPASYSINIKGRYKYWIDKDNPVEGDLVEGQSFIMRSNSIAYVQLEPYFRLPNYIAARFNLQIKHVYRGLLLGTGPLVDPGFEGNLYIPLHNLTGGDYIFKCGEPLIWMEFTKVSNNDKWSKSPDSITPKGKFIEFKLPSKKQELEDYLNKAKPNSPILSSIPLIISKTQELNTKSEDNLNRSEATFTRADTLIGRYNVAVIIAIVALLITVVVALGSYMYYFINVFTNTKNIIEQYENREKEMYNKFEKEIRLRDSILNNINKNPK